MSIALENFRAAPVQTLELAGNLLRYRVFGDGPAVVLVHGWPLSGVTYRVLIEALRPHYRCYVPDLPGAGDTPWWPQITDTMGGYAVVLRDFVDALALERFALIAHDSGGGAARLLAAELGQRVRSLILQNTELPGHLSFQLRLLKLASASSELGATLLRVLGSTSLRRSGIAFGGCFSDRSLIDGEFFEACLQPLLSGITGHLEILRHIDLDWSARLDAAHARISAPVHLFWGEADRYFPLARARQLLEKLPNPGELRAIPGAKLYVHEEAAEQLADFALPLLAAAFAVVPNPQRSMIAR